MARVNCKDAFKAWTEGKSCRKAQSVWTDGQAIYSYGTVIVQQVGPSAVVFNAMRYSSTTSCHQNALQRMLEDGGYTISFV